MSVTDRAIQGIANATRVRSLRAGHLMAIILLIVAACGGSAQPSPSAPTITAPARSIAPSSPAPVVTITPSNAISAVAGFERWLAQTDLDYDLAVDGVALNWGPTFGMVHVEGPDSFQLITTEGMAIWVFERSSLGGRTSRSVGVAYQPAAAQLLPVERLQDALAASTGWVDAGTKEEGGRTLHHLLATTTAISDQGLTSGTAPDDPPFAASDPPDGKVDAWVTAEGVPVSFDYTSSALSLEFLVEPVLEPVNADAAPLVRHPSKAFGYSFMAAPGTDYVTTSDGEAWRLGPIAFLTYCKPRSPSDNLEGWATDGTKFYTKVFGEGEGILYAEVAPQGIGLPGMVDVAISTYQGTTATYKGKSVVSAAFGTKTHWCDVQAIAPAEHADEAHALLARLLVTLEVHT